MPPEINFYNPRSILLFVCILQGVIFAILLVLRGLKKKSQSDFLLAGLLIVMCTGLISHFIGFANVYDNNQFLTYFPFELAFAHAPVIYLYVKTLTDSKRRLNVRDLLYFVPAIVHWSYFFGLFLQDMEFKRWYGNTSTHFSITVFRDISLFAWNGTLFFLSISHYRKYRLWLDENYSDTELIKFKWLRNFLYIFAAVFLIESFFDAVSIFVDFSYVQAFYLKLFVAFVTYYLASAGYLRSSEIEVEFQPGLPKDRIESRDEEIEGTKRKLLEVMENERPYRDPQLTLRALSMEIGVNTSRLSQTINKGFGKNFNDFVNGYRIDEVKEKLAAAAGGMTMLEIAFDSGFNSKATFNRSFKKFTGISPGEYVESLSNNS